MQRIVGIGQNRVYAPTSNLERHFDYQNPMEFILQQCRCEARVYG
jgi:hypothetical protein